MPEKLAAEAKESTLEIRSLSPVLAAVAVCAAALLALIFLAIARSGGHFGYPMDDTYIHMAMAKNFAQSGIWGVTRYAFSSSTSSPLYTLLLAGTYGLFGVSEWTPLILNVLAAGGLLIAMDAVLTKGGYRPGARCILLTAFALAIPLPILILGGMEHVLQALVVLAFIHCSGIALARDVEGGTAIVVAVTLAAAAVAIRYESLFLVATAAGVSLMRKKVVVAGALSLAGLLPVAVYGVICGRHGWYPVPTSLILKANLPSTPLSGMYPGFLDSLVRNLTRGSHVVTLAALAGLLLVRSWQKWKTPWTHNGVTLFLFIGTAILHLTLARTGWFFRYEAYLVGAGLVFIAVTLREVGLPAFGRLGTALAFVFGCLAVARTTYAFYVAPQAMVDIYDQQYQMGLFAQRNWAGKTIVVNDIGAVSFLSDARVLDPIGLGSIEAARARVDGKYTKEWLANWAASEHADAAIMYPHLAPERWDAEQAWSIPGNYMSGSDTVNFYPLVSAGRVGLKTALDEFDRELPRRVLVNRISGAK